MCRMARAAVRDKDWLGHKKRGASPLPGPLLKALALPTCQERATLKAPRDV